MHYDMGDVVRLNFGPNEGKFGRVIAHRPGNIYRVRWDDGDESGWLRSDDITFIQEEQGVHNDNH